MPEGVGGGVTLEAEILARLHQQGGIRLAVRIVADRAASDGHGAVNEFPCVLPLVALAAELGVVGFDAVARLRFFVAETAVLFRDYPVGPVQAVGHLLGDRGVVKEIDRVGECTGSAEADDVDAFLQREHRRENALFHVEDELGIIEFQSHLPDERVSYLADQRRGQAVDDRVVCRCQDLESARRLAVVFGTVAGEDLLLVLGFRYSACGL